MLEGDCQLRAVCEVLKEYGVVLRPSVCFGIGGGLEFDGWVERFAKTPFLMISGRRRSTERIALSRLGFACIDLCVHEGAVQNELELDRALEEHAPILVILDRYYLGYLKERFGGTHCGYHMVAIYERSGENYKVYDALSPETKTVPVAEVTRARGSDVAFLPPKYQGFYLKETTSQHCLSHASIIDAIVSNLDTFLDGEKHGALKYARFIDLLTETFRVISVSSFAKAYWRSQRSFFITSIAEFEDSKSFYRGLYTEFLRTVLAEHGVGSRDLVERFTDLSAGWNDLAVRLHRQKECDPKTAVDTTITAFSELFAKEREVVSAVRDCMRNEVLLKSSVHSR